MQGAACCPLPVSMGKHDVRRDTGVGPEGVALRTHPPVRGIPRQKLHDAADSHRWRSNRKSAIDAERGPSGLPGDHDLHDDPRQEWLERFPPPRPVRHHYGRTTQRRLRGIDR